MGPCGPSHRVFTGLSRQHLADVIVELADPWTAAHQGALRQRRGHPRRRAPGAGPHHRLVLADRVLVTLVILRFQLPHQALAVLYGVDRATVTRAVGEVRPLLAARGFAVPGLPGVRLRTLADVFATPPPTGSSCASTAPRPRSAGPGPTGPAGGRLYPASASRTRSRPPPSPTVGGRTLWAGAVRPGRMHDQTAVTTEGIKELLRYYPTVMARVDTGYRGLAKAFPDRVCAPPPKPAKDAPAEEIAAYKQARTRQSSRRICVEHAIAEHKQWRPLQRYIGRREVYAQTHLAIAGLVSDRAARR